MKVISVDGYMGTVEAMGVRREADLAMVQPVEVGTYVLVHAGFAIQTIDEEEAIASMDALRELTEHADAEESQLFEEEERSRFFQPPPKEPGEEKGNL